MLTLLLRRFLVARLRQATLADWASTIAVVAIGVAAVAHARRYAGTTIDDAFITYRHALNLVHGHGFTCNVGERIEGTSSPLFALAMAVPIAFGADPYRAAGFLGTIALVGCVVVAYAAVRICLPDRPSRILGLGAAALVASSPILALLPKSCPLVKLHAKGGYGPRFGRSRHDPTPAVHRQNWYPSEGP